MTIGVDKQVRIWDFSPKYLARWNTHQGKVWSLSFSLDEQQIATAGEDGTVQFWDCSGQLHSQWQTSQGPITKACFSPNVTHFMTAGRNSLQIWTVTGESLHRWNPYQETIVNATFSPNGENILTIGSDGTAKLWNLEGQRLASFKSRIPNAVVINAGFSPDGKQVVTGGWDGTIIIWDLNGTPVAQWTGDSGRIREIYFSRDGEKIITAQSAYIKIWNLTGQKLAQWQADPEKVLYLCFSPEGHKIATVGFSGAIQLWDLSGRSLAQWDSSYGETTSLNFSPDGKFIAASQEDCTVTLWPVETLDELLSRGSRWVKDYLEPSPQEVANLESDYPPLYPSAQPTLAEAFAYPESNRNEPITEAIASEPNSPIFPQDSLPSESAIYYIELRDLLATGKWQEADKKTRELMLKISSAETKGYLSEKDYEIFPCADLIKINQLWVESSQGHFGFSVQNQIWETIGGSRYADGSAYFRFANAVGWRQSGLWLTEKNLEFNLNAVKGHLPCDPIWHYTINQTYGVRSYWRLCALFSRLNHC